MNCLRASPSGLGVGSDVRDRDHVRRPDRADDGIHEGKFDECWIGHLAKEEVAAQALFYPTNVGPLRSILGLGAANDVELERLYYIWHLRPPAARRRGADRDSSGLAYCASMRGRKGSAQPVGRV